MRRRLSQNLDSQRNLKLPNDDCTIPIGLNVPIFTPEKKSDKARPYEIYHI